MTSRKPITVKLTSSSFMSGIEEDATLINKTKFLIPEIIPSRLKEIESTVSWTESEEETFNDATFKMKNSEQTTYNKEMIETGIKIYQTMSHEQRQQHGNKSGTLHFVQLLGLQSVPYQRSLGGGGHVKEKCSYPVGITLSSDEDIVIPVISITKDNISGIDPEKDITVKEVKAKEKFHLTYYEFMWLIARHEYGGFFEANGDVKGGFLSLYFSNYHKGKAKLPTPTIQFKRNNRIRYANDNNHNPILSNIVDIDKKGPNGWIIKPDYAEKFNGLRWHLLQRKKEKKAQKENTLT